MGYILPVAHYTYQNYHRRLIDKKKDPYYVEAPYRVGFYKIKDDRFNHHQSFQDILEEKERQLAALHVDAKEKATLTGKGKTINERI